MHIPTLWKANIIAFISSFCVMVIELIAARILAPYIGVSLYTWTSIIGIILAGIALGNYIGGITALLRYNFVQPGWRLVPYVHGGVGIVYTDAYKDKTQRAIGQAIEFTPQCSLGFRYLIKKNWSLDAEAMFHHISNAGLDKRNRSINAIGGFVGVTYFFDEIWKP